MFFLFLFFSSLFSVSPPFSLSLYYILWFFTPFPPSTCGSGVGSLFSLLHLPLLEPSILMTESTKLFIFAVVFLQPLCSFSFFFSSSPFLCPLLFLFLRIIYYGFLHHFLYPRVGLVLGVIFLCFPCLFLNLPFLVVRLLVHYSGITSTLMRPES